MFLDSLNRIYDVSKQGKLTITTPFYFEFYDKDNLSKIICHLISGLHRKAMGIIRTKMGEMGEMERDLQKVLLNMWSLIRQEVLLLVQGEELLHKLEYQTSFQQSLFCLYTEIQSSPNLSSSLR